MKLVMASGNAGKLKEFSELLAPLGWQVLPQSDFAVPGAEETGLTFVENAIIKARNACEHSGLPALADDSGIEVDALNGAPGIHSARFAGEHGNDAANNALLIEKLADVPVAQRTARYHALLVFLRHANDPTPIICHGSWEGRIIDQPRGDNGFGYDPYFYVPELDKTAAELDAEHKNRISHRGKAVDLLLARLRGL